jgi:hypothetical protein
MGSIRCPETSVKDYHSTLRNIPEEGRCQYQGAFCGGYSGQGAKLTTHIRLSAEVQKEWRYTFTPPIHIHGVDKEKFTF